MYTKQQIEDKARSLAPWHFDIELPYGLRTVEFNQSEYEDSDKANVRAVPGNGLVSFFNEYYPGGLSGKSVLDVGCNSGAYCFSAHDLGADRVTGFDVRPHWINQANFVREARYPTAQGIKFELGDAKVYLRENPEKFDIVIFKGVFYHLPDPISILYELANAAREVILIDTASSDEVSEDCLKIFYESKTRVMSGVDGLAWLPGGPKVIEIMLRHCGFTKFSVPYWHHGMVNKNWGRFRIIGQR